MLSIIIPIYNQSAYLERCLKSVSRQTLHDIEIICVDDGSTDNCFDIIEKCKDERFIVLRQNNQGTGAARNGGMRVAAGDYIGFVDADDWVAENYFESLYAKAKTENADICCALKRMEVYNDKMEAAVTPFFDNLKQNQRQLVFTALHLWSKIFKSSFVRKHNLLNAHTKRGQDISFCLPAVLLASQISAVEDTEYFYRIRKNSACHGAISKNDCQELADIFAIAAQYCVDKEMLQTVVERMTTMARYYAEKTNFTGKIALFQRILDRFPKWRGIGASKIEMSFARMLNLLK